MELFILPSFYSFTLITFLLSFEIISILVVTSESMNNKSIKSRTLKNEDSYIGGCSRWTKLDPLMFVCDGLRLSLERLLSIRRQLCRGPG